MCMTIKEIISQVHPIDDVTASALERVARRRTFAKRERLVEQDARCSSVFFISRGLCRGLHEGDGREDTRWFASEGDALTSVTAWHTGAPAIFAIEAVTDVEAYEVSFADMRRLLGECPDLKEWLVKVLMEQLYVPERRYVIIGTGDARARYEALLNGRPQEMLNAIPLKFIAQYLNITQETLSRIRAAYGKS